MKKVELNNKRVIISRTDSIGDVMLTLPLCYYIKEQFENCEIHFLGQSYTRPILELCSAIDQVHAWDEIEKLPVQSRCQALKAIEADCFIHVFPTKQIAKTAKKTGIPIRVGTSHRPYNLLNCTHRINFTRKSAKEHEAQLNFHLLKPFGVNSLPNLEKVTDLVSRFKSDAQKEVNAKVAHILEGGQKKVILHLKSKGSALEWPAEEFIELAELLVNANYKVLLTGTEAEGKSFRKYIPENKNIEDVSGKLDLKELILLTANIDGLIACSTGPLHIAAALGVKSLGLYLDKRPIHPGRWKPIGKKSKYMAQPYQKEMEEKDIKSLEFKPKKVFEIYAKM